MGFFGVGNIVSHIQLNTALTSPGWLAELVNFTGPTGGGSLIITYNGIVANGGAIPTQPSTSRRPRPSPSSPSKFLNRPRYCSGAVAWPCWPPWAGVAEKLAADN